MDDVQHLTFAIFPLPLEVCFAGLATAWQWRGLIRYKVGLNDAAGGVEFHRRFEHKNSQERALLSPAKHGHLAVTVSRDPATLWAPPNGAIRSDIPKGRGVGHTGLL